MDTTTGSALSSSLTSDEGGVLMASGAGGGGRRSGKLDDIDEDVDDDEDDDEVIEEDEGDADATAAAILNIEARLDKALSDVNAMTVDRLASSLSKSLVTGDMPDQEKEQLFATLASSTPPLPPSSQAPTTQTGLASKVSLASSIASDLAHLFVGREGGRSGGPSGPVGDTGAG